MPNILLLEDNPGDAHLIQELLSDVSNLDYSFTVTHVERTQDAINILKQDNNIEVILSDITLPDSRGVETLNLLTQAASHIPVLFMTGTNDEALAVAALHKGAQDYLVKGHASGDMLARSLQYAIERKHTQNEVEQIKAREVQNLERIKSLAKEKNQLMELNRSKDEFVSIASHQLRTPATAVKQFIGLITEGFAGKVDDAAMEILKSAYDSNERQLGVIDELLKTAQIDSNDMALELERSNIRELLTEVIDNQMPIIKNRNQKVDFVVNSEQEVTIDRGEIRLVLENLLENASKYSPHGTTITIETECENKLLSIHFKDEGVGIDKEDLSKIFDKFTRVDNDLSDTVTGTGLGLYWAKRILMLHGGRIDVESKPTKGSIFTARLPL